MRRGLVRLTLAAALAAGPVLSTRGGETPAPSVDEAPLRLLTAAERKVDPKLLQQLIPLLQQRGRLDPQVAKLLQARLADGGWAMVLPRYRESLAAFNLPPPRATAPDAAATALVTADLQALLAGLAPDRRLLAAAPLCASLPALAQSPAFVQEVADGFLHALTPTNLGQALTTAQAAAAAAPGVPLFAQLADLVRQLSDQERQRAAWLSQAASIEQGVRARHEALVRFFSPENLYERRKLEALPTAEKKAKTEELKRVEESLRQARELRARAQALPAIAEAVAAAREPLLAPPGRAPGETKP